MTPQEFALFERSKDVVPAVSVSEIVLDRSDRTLLWGYDVERRSFHVYLKDGMLCRVVYNYDGDLTHADTQRAMPVDDLIPNKRLYPEACDAEFCDLLLTKGARLPFTDFDDTRPAKQFHGRILVDGVLSPRA